MARVCGAFALLFVALTASGGTNGWFRVGLLAVPIVQRVDSAFRRVPAMKGEMKLVRTAPGEALAYCDAAPPDGLAGEPLASLDGIRRVVTDWNLTEIPAFAFADAKDLETVELGGKVRLVGRRAFAGAAKLACVVLAEPVSTDVAGDAFAGVSADLTAFYPFSPTIAAGDARLVRDGLLFPRVAFGGGDCRNRSLFVAGDWLWSPEGAGAALLAYLGGGGLPAEFPREIAGRPVVSVGRELREGAARAGGAGEAGSVL